MTLFHEGYDFPPKFPQEVNWKIGCLPLNGRHEMRKLKLWLDRKGIIPKLQKLAAEAVVRVYGKEEFQRLEEDVQLSQEVKQVIFSNDVPILWESSSHDTHHLMAQIEADPRYSEDGLYFRFSSGLKPKPRTEEEEDMRTGSYLSEFDTVMDWLDLEPEDHQQEDHELEYHQQEGHQLEGPQHGQWEPLEQDHDQLLVPLE
jgi:hypothetical protein